MSVNDKLKQMRELNRWSQEEIAEKINIAPSSYAKIERGETRLTLDRLEQFAEVFNVDITKLIQSDGFNVHVYENLNNNENSQISMSCNNSASAEKHQLELEKLQLIINHKDELLTQKDKEIQALRELVALLKRK